MSNVQSQFGANAQKYLSSAVHSDQSDLARLVSIARPSGGSLLDIATGAGHVALAFAPFMDRVVASDPTQKMLDVAQAEADRRGLTNFETCLCWAEDLPFVNESFEAVTCRMAPHHFRSPEQFVAEVFRVLKPGGWFLLADNTGIDRDQDAHQELQAFESRRDPSHVEDYTIDQWVKWLSAQGFVLSFQQELKKTLVLEDWLARMQVNEVDSDHLRRQLEQAKGALGAYLNRKVTDSGEVTFELAETTLFARKPAI